MDTSHLLYASDLTDTEWALLEPLVPPESPIGRPRRHSLRTILNALFESVAHRGRLALSAAGVAAVADGVLVSASVAA